MIGADSNGHVGEGNRGDENVMGMWWKAYPRGENGDRADSNGHVGEGNRGDENVMGMCGKHIQGERMVIGADSNGHVGKGNRGDENVMGMWWKAYPRGENGDRGRLQWSCWRREQM